MLSLPKVVWTIRKRRKARSPLILSPDKEIWIHQLKEEKYILSYLINLLAYIKASCKSPRSC
uniref:Uncharacterized protein n=1 Tax=Solanum lycopersicum TaxID=4081 RepID=A0A3Q7FG69_SOLLC